MRDYIIAARISYIKPGYSLFSLIMQTQYMYVFKLCVQIVESWMRIVIADGRLFPPGRLLNDCNYTRVVCFREGLVVQARLIFSRRVSCKAFHTVLHHDRRHLSTDP